MLDKYYKVLVTGGLGFIGKHLAHRLLQLGKQVTLLDDYSTTYEPERVQGRKIKADLRDSRAIREAVQGNEVLFHTGANSNGSVSVRDPRLDSEINVLGTFNVAEAAAACGVKRLVYVSSASVYGVPQRFPIDEEHPLEPFVPYGASKLAGELAALDFFHSRDLPVVIGRPFCVYGPGENPNHALVEVSRFARWALNDHVIPVIGDPKRKTRDFVHVHDLVTSLLLLADRGTAGQRYNIGTGTEISMEDLAATISAAIGKEARIQAHPGVTDDTYRLVGDIGKLRSLGYEPSVAIADGVADLVKTLGEKPALPGGLTIFKEGQAGEE